MELAAVLLGLAIIVVVLGTPIVALIALTRTSKQVAELRELRAEVTALRSWVRRLPQDVGDVSSGDPEVAVESFEPEIAAVPDFRRVSMRTRVSGPPYLRTTPSDPAPEAAEAAEPAEEGALEAETASEQAVDAAATETESAPPLEDAVVSPDAPASVGGPPTGRDPRPETRPAQGGLAAARTAIDFETLIGSTWLLRIGLGVLAIAFALFARTIVPQLPAAAKVALAYAAAMALFATGKVFETKLEKFARPVMAAGLAFGFFVAYASYFVPAMGAVSLPVSVGWMVVSMVTVLLAAERWESQGTAALAILLGHISAFVSTGEADIYSLVMITFLAVTAAVLMLRHAWVLLGLFAVVVSYGSHLLWILADRSPIAQDVGFWLNLSFLTSYYVAFLIADVLWWRRDGERDEEEPTDAHVAVARQLGPMNLLLYVSVTSFVYVATGAGLETIEWFYLTLGVAQGALAWFYWGVRHRDFTFYPAFGTVLWTMGLFAALGALALNLVLVAQALLLLLVAHHTRLWIFHGLAQLALVVAFLHYLGYPAPVLSTWGLLLGGLGIAAVYLLKASLEEVWYAEETPDEWMGDVEREAGPSYLRETFTDLFGGLAPYLAPVHAALGGFVLVRELFRHFGPGREAALALLVVHALLAVVVVVRRRGALLFAFTSVALSAPYLAALSADPLATVLLLDGLLAVGLALQHVAGRRLPGATADEAGAHTQAVVVVALLGGFLALEALELGFAAYLPALSLPFLVLLFQERRSSGEGAVGDSEGAEAGSAESTLSTLVCLVAALAVVRTTVEVVGIVAVGPVWVAGWAVAIILVSAWRRSSQLFLAGYGLLVVGYVVFLTRDSGALQEVVGTLWIGVVVSVVPLTLALGMDRSIRGRSGADEPVHDAAGPMTYLMYGLGFLLLSALADEQLPPGWSLVAPSLLGLGLMVQADRLGAERAVPAVVAVLMALHASVFSLTRGDAGIDALLLPLLVLAAATLGAERVLAARQTEEGSHAMWRVARMVLVVLATWTMMAAIYESTQLGTQWATAGWSVLGVALMGAGFGLRSAMHRRVALFVLGACVLRVFIVDTQGLSDTARTVAFFVLGLCLIGAAWLYSRFSEELRSWI